MRASLLDLLARESARPDAVRAEIATVSAVTGRLVDVDLKGTTVQSVPTAKAYASPAVGDVVLVLKIGASWIAVSALG